MLRFYKLLIFIIIFIYKTNEKRPQQHVFLTAATGELKCRTKVGSGAVVTLYAREGITMKERVISSKFVHYNDGFFISGTIKSFVKPFFYLRIYHICKIGKTPQITRFTKIIYLNHVTRFGKKGCFQDVGVLDLSTLGGKKISYLNYSRRQIKFR